MSGKTADIRHLKPSMEALGLVVAYLSRELPFSDYRAGRLVAAVKYQLSSRNHVCLLSGDLMLAYAGWLPITTDMGERWMRNQVRLTPTQPEAADAAALTVVSVSSGEHLLPLIRACRKLNPQRRIFFKRDAADEGRTRKATVFNR